jgi:NAD(P)-dependent dehydrogenase (short-subunit alcohol dehydrogenase family)
MALVFITGSTDGLGRLAAETLIQQGHRVVIHARNARRAQDAGLANGEAVVIGDLSSIAEMRAVAAQVNELGEFDAVIHNAGVGYRPPFVETEDGLPHVFAVNTLAPYVLTALIEKPSRLVYISSGLHRDADTSLNDVIWRKRRWKGLLAYCESKFHDILLAFAVARRWPDVLSNALEPGWVPTRMGGTEAPENLRDGAATQVWLAAADDPEALVSGQYFYHQRLRNAHPHAYDEDRQNKLLVECAAISGIELN